MRATEIHKTSCLFLTHWRTERPTKKVLYKAMGNEAQMSSKNIFERPCFIVVNIHNLEPDTALLNPNSATFYL